MDNELTKVKPPKELYAPPSVRERLLPLHTDPPAKEATDEDWLVPIQSDLRRMPMHTALGMAEAIISHLPSECKVEEFALALAMNRWARELAAKGGKLGNTNT